MPTRSISSTARASASRRFMPKWVLSVSRIWRPIVSTGFREDIGSWKIIAISRPRIPRSARSLCRIRSRPSNSARPLRTRPLRASRPRTASDVTLLPHPDSPTIPSVSPRAISKETPLTAYTVPRRVENSTLRSSTPRSGSLAFTQLRVERLAQTVADQVEAEHREDDRDARDDREERGRLEVVVHVREHRSPFGGRRVLRTEAEEAEAGDVDDRRRHRERPLDDHGRDRVGKDVREQDRAPAYAHRTRREDEVVLPLRQDRPAKQARGEREVHDADGDHDLKEAR